MSTQHLVLDNGLPLKKALARYKKRRQELAKAIGHPIVITGLPHGPNHIKPWSHLATTLYQDPILLYLTGINQTQVAIIIDPESGKETLFLPKKDPKKEFWDGHQLGVGDPKSEKEAQTLTGVESLADIETLIPTILQKKAKKWGLFWHTSKTKKTLNDHHNQFRKTLKRQLKKQKKTSEVINIAPTYWPMHLTLDSTDQNNLKKALSHTRQILKEIKSHTPPFTNEQEIAGYIQGRSLQLSWSGISFAPIIANGKNACTLHYAANNAPIDPNQFLLLDFGVCVQDMHADLSDTFTLSGKQSPLQEILYTIVKDTQKEVEHHVKAGVTLNQLNTLAWDYMNNALKEQILDKGGSIRTPYDKAPHFIGHLLGRQVHDGCPFRSLNDTPLKPNWAITNEPGFYGEVTLTINKKELEFLSWLEFF